MRSRSAKGFGGSLPAAEALLSRSARGVFRLELLSEDNGLGVRLWFHPGLNCPESFRANGADGTGPFDRGDGGTLIEGVPRRGGELAALEVLAGAWTWGVWEPERDTSP